MDEKTDFMTAELGWKTKEMPVISERNYPVPEIPETLAVLVDYRGFPVKKGFDPFSDPGDVLALLDAYSRRKGDMRTSALSEKLAEAAGCEMVTYTVSGKRSWVFGLEVPGEIIRLINEKPDRVAGIIYRDLGGDAERSLGKREKGKGKGA